MQLLYLVFVLVGYCVTTGLNVALVEYCLMTVMIFVLVGYCVTIVSNCCYIRKNVYQLYFDYCYGREWCDNYI